MTSNNKQSANSYPNGSGSERTWWFRQWLSDVSRHPADIHGILAAVSNHMV